VIDGFGCLLRGMKGTKGVKTLRGQRSRDRVLGPADLTDTQRAKISHRNAERLFRLPPANWRAAPGSARPSRRSRSA
jgi:hypothetical protein